MEGPGLLFLIVGIVVVLVWYHLKQPGTLLERYDGQTYFAVGKYLVGLDNCNYPTNGVECIVIPHQFVFAKMNGQELGRIPRDSIEEVAFDDKSQIAQRLTATRMVALGVFALAAPKRRKIKEWCVAVRWVDGEGLRRSTVFEFSGGNPAADANKTANGLMRYVQQRQRSVEVPTTALATISIADSRTCPVCAETIKAATIVCRFCNRQLFNEIVRNNIG
jgi:hypothetical protein